MSQIAASTAGSICHGWSCGRRDALLTLTVQTGLRVSELTNLIISDMHLGTGSRVHCMGKGRKHRVTPLTSGTPLWLYVLKEAQYRAGGDALGPVAGKIVAEVLIGLTRADGESYLSVGPTWRPTLPSADPDRFGLADLLVFAAREG
jgi:integrase